MGVRLGLAINWRGWLGWLVYIIPVLSISWLEGILPIQGAILGVSSLTSISELIFGKDSDKVIYKKVLVTNNSIYRGFFPPLGISCITFKLKK